MKRGPYCLFNFGHLVPVKCCAPKQHDEVTLVTGKVKY
jgi:hypothetical protein